LPDQKTYFILLATIHDILKAEKALKEQEIEGEVIPVPRTLSTDCGVCIKSSASPDVLGPLLHNAKGLKCFSFDGTGYELVDLPH
jgi:hypothetical protein